ncbi:endonuclease/exonuclease/phosphatase family protein [Microbacterium sp. cx-55]|uniref:endonuclease/exonuclease/phosphatase family protein n=1 Tax=unclassified Microbacterium TaxID=2609290 RepID=UPI001CBF28F2|nr:MULTISPECIES: endonuclease/exonuclease/phosphatase family protein [unclassified Microbacterium]MBZ4485912.1 endonuclease/exonuclease/phosphatase family protein [Microbacterium sp. cx-55]MCC4906873.1 endonuclease/exonuclease/phosphatase family protein [Microbacterium sp. cx-59]UGB34212.1 endonuclease/exonuclease/phosphatase family protein [Microbacterium sp. cx-55]
MRRLFGILVIVLCAIGAAVLTWPDFFRLAQTYPLAQVISFRVLVVAGFAVLVVVFLLLATLRPVRRFALSLAVIALAAAVAGGAIVATRGTGTQTLPEKTADSIRVMTWNTAGAATSAETIAQTAVAMGADIVSLPETTIETGAQVAVAMRDLGQPMWAHHTEYGTDGWAADSTTLLVSPNLGTYSVIESSQDGSSNTSTVPSAVAMPTDGDGPIIVAAHAVAPREDAMDDWRHDLQWLADQCADDNVIMAGDFNATIDHMARLGADGGVLGRCRDAASQTGNGAVGTWPTQLPALAGAQIDHVLATPDWTPTGSVVLTTLDDAGSDHRPLVVQLERTG